MENEIEELREQLAKLIEDRARFPDRPDFIGNMISAHIGNLKAGKQSSDEYARKYILRLNVCEQRNAELEARLLNITDFVESLCSSAGDQPSVATGYLRDILDIIKNTESEFSE